MGEMGWQTNLSIALELAKNNNKVLFIFFHGTGCKACAEMEKTTFTEEKAQEFVNKHFVPVHFRADRKPAQFLRFNVAETPTYIILDTGGNEMHRLSGYLSAEDFIEKLAKAI